MSIRDARKQQNRQALLNAALQLSTSGRAFSTLSLREVTREVGLVPTAFYRHFADMQQLGEALVGEVGQSLRQVILQLRQGYRLNENAKTQSSIILFFQAVEQKPQDWIFLIAERWGGSYIIRQCIAQEIDLLIQTLAKDLNASNLFKHVQSDDDLYVMSSILINLSFNWAMTWLKLLSQPHTATLIDEKKIYIEQVATEVRLLFRGISNWQSDYDRISKPDIKSGE